MSAKEIEFMAKNLPITNKTAGPGAYQKCKKKIIRICKNCSRKLKTRLYVSTYLCDQHYSDCKTRQRYYKKNYRLISLMKHRCKILIKF